MEVFGSVEIDPISVANTSESSTLTGFTTAAAPFDDLRGDIVLRTSDNVDFRVYSIILSLASPFFRDLFSLPQPSHGLEDTTSVIPMTEDSHTVDTMLRYCYPGNEPSFDDLSHIRSVMEAMSKYDMGEMAKRVRKHLLTFVDKEPLRVFAIACRYRWEECAKEAAKATLNRPILETYVDDLEHIPAAVYHRLLVYHQQCGQAASNLSLGLRWMSPQPWVWFRCRACAQHGMSWYLSDGQSHSVRLWFIEYLQRAANALKERPAVKTAIDPVLMAPFVTKAASCTTCHASALVDLTAFAMKDFSNEIERVLSLVVLDLKL